MIKTSKGYFQELEEALKKNPNLPSAIARIQDVKKAQDLIHEAAVTSRYVYLPKPVIVRVSQVIVNPYIAMRLRVKVYVLDTKLEKALVSDVTLRVHEAFQKEGIQPPGILHRTLTDMQGKDLPSTVNLEESY